MKKWFFCIGVFFFFFLSSSSFCSIHYLRPKKTGSTTISFLLQEHIDPKNIYRDDKKNLCLVKNSGEARKKLDSMRNIEENDLVIGHFPMWFFEEKVKHNAPCFWFTTLRDPIERVLSQYRYMNMRGFRLANPLDVQPNHMCRILASDPTLSGHALLKNAIANLHKMDVVIFLDDFEYGIRQLFDALCLPQPEAIPKRNRTKKEPFDPLLLDQIRNLNSLDILLYDYALSHFGR